MVILNPSLKKSIKFSVVISVYLHDDVDYFIESMNSILNQTLMPSEVILAVDGPVTSSIKDAIKNFESNPIVFVIRSDNNIGRGAIRHRAILSSTTKIIAIMDSDDISADNRFELQVKSLINSKADFVGGYISEFTHSTDDFKRERKVPLKHAEILRRGKWIQPFNHVTIMFHKSMYIKSGGYAFTSVLEDSYLFFRMVKNNAQFHNIPKTLVYVRANNDQLLRRHGLKYFKEEFFLYLAMFRSGYINLWNLLINLVIRFTLRCAPIVFLRFFTKFIFRSNLHP